MSHTYSRTSALLDEFAQSFGPADLVIHHNIYASAREAPISGITGQALAEQTRRYHPQVAFFPEPLDSVSPIFEMLKPGDLFVTMGAGDNWKLGRHILRLLQEKDGQ